jgi:hypothetical protein
MSSPFHFITDNLPLIIGGFAALVIILGVVIGMITMRRGPKVASRWAHGAYGLWSGAEDSGTWPSERAQQSLQSWYGIGDRPALMRQVESLKTGPAHAAAWDMCRAIDLLRIGFAAGYLDEDDCWEHVRQVSLLLQKQYKSWEELGAAFERGMHNWQDQRGQTDANERGRVQRNLPVLRAEVWPKVDFTATWD